MTKHSRTAGAQLQEAARLERTLAQKDLGTGDRESAWNRLFGVLTRISPELKSPQTDALFVSTCLELSSLSFVMGKGFGEMTMFLQNALEAADRLGDRRSGALIKLHLGRLYYFGERRHDAMSVFAQGKAEVEELGDEDILTRSAEFLGLYFFIQGMFTEAIIHFERALESFESAENDTVVNPSAPIWLGYCAAYLGEFHRAIGILDYCRRFALQKGDRSLAATIRAVLGIVLMLVRKKQEAAHHLSGAFQEATKTKNALALYFAKGGLAYHHCLEGRLTETRDLLMEAISEGAAAGLIRQYASPMVLEMLFELHRSRMPQLPEMSFRREIVRLLQEPNTHLRGVALRLRALDRALSGEQPPDIMADLEASEACLMRAGTPVQLAKTRIEMARFKLVQGDRNTARRLAQAAWEALSAYGDDFFPDDLRHLLEVGNYCELNSESRDEFMARFMDLTQELVPTANLDRLLNRTVAATNRYFGAERGGIFWFSRNAKGRNPIMRAALNLTHGDIEADDFKPNLDLIMKTHRENAPQLVRLKGSQQWPYREKAILCMPFDVEGATRGVLYHDNSYLDGCFDFLDEAQIVQMARYLSTYVGQVHGYCLRLQAVASDFTPQAVPSEGFEIMTQSATMDRVLAQADRVASSDSSVLILGETGVGKELLARRVHRNSPRRDNPLIIVDPTTIPEGLVESELFGHEKGAFTGADRQKKGRMEIAHGGTLFIDEVGEIPRSIQVKLLRVLQEKALVRVGGTRTLSSDFRLVAATNRDLAQEVAAGRFREDLYYRLNVVPLALPPLRERSEDVGLLARHFLGRYSAKYNRSGLRITPEDEAQLAAYHWPGNVRELQNVMERAVLLATGEQLAIDLPSELGASSANPFEDLPTMEELQRRYIRFVLARAGGQISGKDGAAEILGMKRTSLYSRMEKLGMR